MNLVVISVMSLWLLGIITPKKTIMQSFLNHVVA